MSSIRFIAAGLLGAGLFTAGCAAPSDTDPDAPSDTDPVETAELPIRRHAVPIGCNGLLPSDFWAPARPRGVPARSAGAALVGANNVVVPTPLLGTSGGRSVLDYTVRCALSSEQVVYGPDGRRFYGSFGFAPEWTGRGLTTSEQRWVSCVHLPAPERHRRACGYLSGWQPPGPRVLLGRGALRGVRRPRRHDVRQRVPSFGHRRICLHRSRSHRGALVALAELPARSRPPLAGAALWPRADVRYRLPRSLRSDLPDGRRRRSRRATRSRSRALSWVRCSRPSYSETIRSYVRDSDLLPLYPGCGLL